MGQIQEEWEAFIEVMKDGTSSAKEKHGSYLQLVKIWEDTGNVKAAAYAYYYKSYIFIAKGKYDKVLKEAMKAISYAKQSEPDYWIEKMSYNLLGIAAAKQGYPLTALNYYMKELAVLGEEETQDNNTYQIVNTNIGCLYAELGGYKKAIPFLINAKKYMEKERDGKNIDRECAIYLNLAECYHRTDQIKASRACIRHAEKLLNDTLNHDKYRFTLDVIAYIIELKEGKMKASKDGWKIFESVKLEHKNLSALKILTDYLEEKKEFDKLMVLVRKMEQFGKDHKNKTLCLQALEYRLKYLQYMGKDDEFDEVCISFFEMQTELRKEKDLEKARNAFTYVSLKRIDKQQKALEQRSKELKKKSEYDALTNLKNRYAIQSFADQTFKEAVRKGIVVLVDIIDIDYFKQFNDNYGHISGDRCLTAIAEAISKLIGEEDLGARYGGDEFLVVQLAKTEEEARDLARELKLRIMDCNIPHEYSEADTIVTISQGCYYSIPRKGETLNDFIREADTALREAKKRKRNQAMIRIRDLENPADYSLLEELSETE